MQISAEHKSTIRAMVEADREVALATCDIPHLDPTRYIRPSRTDEALPYCGCFVGVYAWMATCKRGDAVPWYHEVPEIVSELTGHSRWEISDFGMWCNTPARDRAAVCYAREVLAELA